MKNMGSGDITPVLDAYTHGLLGAYPCPRYVMGKYSNVMLFIQSLPEWIGDRILKSGAPKPAACKNL